MILGLCSVTFRELEVDDLVAIAQANSLHTIEWGADVHVPPGDLAHAVKTRKKSRMSGLRQISYGSYYRVGDREQDAPFEDVLLTAQALGAGMIRVWAGSKGSADYTPEERESLVGDLTRIAGLAAEKKIRLTVEYHSNSYTDTPETARELMEACGAPNVYMNWQPDVGGSMAHHRHSIELLAPWVDTVHVFQWDADGVRYPLEDGLEPWQQYVAWLRDCGYTRERYLLEFVKDQDQVQFSMDVSTMREIVGHDFL